MQISIVIPLFNEAESLRDLYHWITRVMEKHGFSFEIIFIDDGSEDGSYTVLSALAEADSRVKLIRFRRNYGKSAGLKVGFEAATGQVVFTMDADLQDSPDELPDMYRMIQEEGYDLVSGWKKKRFDPLSKTIPTKFFNWATRRMSKIPLHDFNCGLKAYRREVVKNIEVQGEMHRYIPVLAKAAGFKKIGEKVVQHRAREHGHTKFGISRFINGPLDLITLSFVSRFAKRPMHFFGLYGSLMFVVGFIATVFIGAEKIIALRSGTPARLVTDNPYFYLALTTMILGTLLFLAGFLAELIIRNSPRTQEYTIAEKRNL